jgi:Ca-activated chloride channel family protein
MKKTNQITKWIALPIIVSLIITAVGLSSCSAMQSSEKIYTTYHPGLTQAPCTEIGDMAYEMDAPEQQFNTEEYNTIVENQFLSVWDQPLSTFSSDVDTASYSMVRRMINEGRTVNADAVRLEEMLNYFNYDYPEPEDGEVFSVSQELIDCPWNDQSRLLMIGVQALDIPEDERPDMNLVYLIDVSGSMTSPDKLGLAVESLKLLTEKLNENDRISIVTYAGSERVVLDGVSGYHKQTIVDALNELQSGGSTHGSAGIEKAYELAEEYFIEGGNNRVILMTDGDLNVGITSEGDLKRLIEDNAKSGIYLSAIGFGTGNYKDNKMETMADNGNGNYNYIDTIEEANKVLVEDMAGTLFTVAKDTKFQVEFNPGYVKAYRLIGYENRKLDNQDFADDTKDAGDVGAGQCVTVMYELVTVDSEMKLPEIDLKYQDDAPTIESDEWLTVSVRYKLPENEESELRSYPLIPGSRIFPPSENIRFASCVVQFGMLLRDSEFKGDSSYNGIIKELSSLDCVSSDDYKKEFLSLVKQEND